MASNPDQTNKLLDFKHAKIHSFYRSSVLLWFVYEKNCSSLKCQRSPPPFFLPHNGADSFSLFLMLITNAT